MSIIDRLNAALAGRYRVERELGAGGMATVYLADDLRHHRKVALKVLDPAIAAAIGAERFLAEIRTTANLQHPNILPLFDSGEADGFLFYVMPYVEGASLRERIAREGRLTLAEATRIASEIAEALEHAHQHGVVHRDIKPANILLRDGRPFVADFGIALEVREAAEHRLTRTGHSIGTPGYMSPEQAAGSEEVDARADIYSLGALGFEMLAGEPPWAGLTTPVAFAKLITEGPPDVRALNPGVPTHVAGAIRKAMAAEPTDRFASAGSFARALEPPARVAAGSRVRWVGMGAAVAAAALAALWIPQSRQTRWARLEAMPEIQRLLGQGEQAQAFALATRAVEALPDDPTLRRLYESATVPVTFTSTPPGARVSYRPYDVEDTVWTDVAATPAAGVRVASEELLVRFELEGHHPRLISLAPTRGVLHATFTPVDETPHMVMIAGATDVRTGANVRLDTFWIDEHEVTNEAYQRFVDDGGYVDPRWWTEPFTAHRDGAGEPSMPDSARIAAELVDLTGRPGPAGWELGRHPPGREQFPVQGVSWFEAVAYCAHRGADLPTYHHWKYADAGEISPWDGALQHGNLGDGDGVVPVGTTDAYSPRGVVDMVGNVREWVWNASRDERYILGGSWQSPPHIYTSFDAIDPWSRDAENGFRCARYSETPAAPVLEPIETPVFDFRRLEPVDDATYETFLQFYEYDDAPLEPARVQVSETGEWIRERAEFDAAYLDERVVVHLFLPKNARPPYHAVVYFPGASAFLLPSSENLSEMSQLMFVPQSGRALLYPVVKGTYERRSERPARGDTETRQRFVWMVQDVMRTVDFIEEQPDLDAERVAYLGLSFGAELALPVAIDKRFRAAVLIGAALDPYWRGSTPEAVAPWNFVGRITTPTLVINGRYDFMHPFDEGQVPFFEAIDVPEADKRFVVLEAGHLPPSNEVIGHTLRWLDERLGPVGTRRPAR